jgi:hypothetical protein
LSKRRWDGLIVCPKDFEHRHPQDFVRARADKIAVPFSRRDPTAGLGIEALAAAVEFSCNHINLAFADIGGADSAHANFTDCSQLITVLQTPTNSSAVAGFAISGYSKTNTSFLGIL